MSLRAAIILATIFAAVLPFSSLSLAASDEEIAILAVKSSAAFKCSIYAHLFDDQKEQLRLFQIGLKAGRDFVEAMKNRDEARNMMKPLPWVSTDFMVGSMYDAEATKAQNEIPSEQRFTSSEHNNPARVRYQESNCSLIN
jgi:hypothetical protein